MSEYWKSTPKYWCKHCKTYVRDTKLEKQQHEATPKHQGNLKRFLRDLHRGHERDERDKSRAKQEVERLNGVVSGTPISASGSSSDISGKRKSAAPQANAQQKQVTPEERKKQLAQLVEMGVAIPEEFRPEMALTGDWQTVSVTPVYSKDRGDEDEDVKPETKGIGIRKRKTEALEEDEDGGDLAVMRVWGSTTRDYPTMNQDDTDLDNLLKVGGSKREPPPDEPPGLRVKSEYSEGGEGLGQDEAPIMVGKPSVGFDSSSESKERSAIIGGTHGDKIVFKKRKGRPGRDR